MSIRELRKRPVFSHFLPNSAFAPCFLGYFRQFGSQLETAPFPYFLLALPAARVIIFVRGVITQQSFWKGRIHVRTCSHGSRRWPRARFARRHSSRRRRTQQFEIR